MLSDFAKREAFISYGSRCEWDRRRRDPDGGAEFHAPEGGRDPDGEAEFQVPVAPVCAPSCASVRS